MTANADKTDSSAPGAASGSSPTAHPKGPVTLAPVTLAIDIGGSGLKAMLLDPAGKPLSERERVDTPAVPTPKA